MGWAAVYPDRLAGESNFRSRPRIIALADGYLESRRLGDWNGKAVA